jgi:thiamine-phosphate pyrophosphorylase
VILHLVTDRRRLNGGGAAAAQGDERRCLLQQIDYAIDAGIDVVQIRERDLEGRELAALVREAVMRTRGTATRIVVNERADVAIACGAAGVHLRSGSMPTAAVRELVRAVGPAGFLIGRSVHDTAEAVAADGADYLIAGAIWPTVSKPDDHPLLGLERFAALAAAAAVPVLAIGGVTVDRAAALRQAGAAGIAGIGLFVGPDGSACRAVPLFEMVAALRRTG